MEFLRDELGHYEEDIKFVKTRGNIFERDYFHRVYIIDFFIGFYMWLVKMDYDLDFFSYYFEKIVSNRNNQNVTSMSMNTLKV